MKTLFLVLPLAVLFNVPICAEQRSFEPLITKSKIEELAVRCKAEITVSEKPSHNNDSSAGIGNPMLYVGVERSNSSEAISCVEDNIPTIITTMVGRAKGIPPLDKKILEGILEKCGWKKSDGFIGFVNGDEILLTPAATADYKRVDCALSGIEPYHPKIGFVGNEQHRAPGKNE